MLRRRFDTQYTNEVCLFVCMFRCFCCYLPHFLGLVFVSVSQSCVTVCVFWFVAVQHCYYSLTLCLFVWSFISGEAIAWLVQVVGGVLARTTCARPRSRVDRQEVGAGESRSRTSTCIYEFSKHACTPTRICALFVSFRRFIRSSLALEQRENFRIVYFSHRHPH
jgi:hypothetical protein